MSKKQPTETELKRVLFRVGRGIADVRDETWLMNFIEEQDAIIAALRARVKSLEAKYENKD